MSSILEALKFKQIYFLTPLAQIIIIILLITIAFITQLLEYIKSGKMYGRYPWGFSIFLSSIYEEIIFRGFVLFSLLTFLSTTYSVIISSVLFGAWHFKNYKWQTIGETVHQTLYSGIFFGPIAAIITLSTGTIWLAVIFHYIHNLFADLFRKK